MGLPAIVERIIKSFTATNAFRTSSIQEDLFVNGFAFTARDVITATFAADMYIHFDARLTNGLQIVFPPLGFVASDAGPITITYYISPTLTAGGRTEIVGSNRRATSSNTYKSIIELVAAGNVSSPGTEFAAQLIPSNSAVGGLANIGASGASGLPFEIDPTVDYLLKIDNTNSADTLFEYNIDWFEVPV